MSNAAGDEARLSARRLRSRLREASVRLPRPAWLRWPSPRADVADPSAAMFQRIRRSMTLLYAAVLAVTLLLAGTVLYVAVQQTVQHTIIEPAQRILSDDITNLSGDWIRNQAFVTTTGGCPLGGPDSSRIMYACYDTHGQFLQAPSYTLYAAENYGVQFTDTSLARAALAAPSGYASDTQRGTSGDVMREACVVRDPSSGQVLGVVQAGQPIGNTLEQLHALLILLLIVGGFTVLISALGGFLLSARALVPARLAYSRQQRFIADVSHELRTPLTLLRADAETLLRGRAKLSEDDAELLDDIVDETARLAALTSSLLTLARLDSSARLPEREMIDLAEVAAQVARRVEAYASERQVTVRVEAAPGLLISGARDLIDQTALILVDNAIKYNSPGGTVDVRAERRGEWVALIVRDTGMGVAPEHLWRLGERFFRPDKARTRQDDQAGGAGLGISIARSVAAAHQGTLTFASAPGEGLTATLELPAARVRQAPAPPPESAPVSGG
ncbi:MAG TPA: ATP-binding protein [Ktedonobacterales bacterium]